MKLESGVVEVLFLVLSSEIKMKSKLDCRKKENKNSWSCRRKKFCNKKENDIVSAGKGIVSLALPAAGVAITAYGVGKSLIKSGVCRR